MNLENKIVFKKFRQIDDICEKYGLDNIYQYYDMIMQYYNNKHNIQAYNLFLDLKNSLRGEFLSYCNDPELCMKFRSFKSK